MKNIWEVRLADHSKPNPASSSAHRLHPEEHIRGTLLARVDDIEIAREITLVAFNISKSIKPAELWNEEYSIRTSATVRRTGCG